MQFALFRKVNCCRWKRFDYDGRKSANGGFFIKGLITCGNAVIYRVHLICNCRGRASEFAASSAQRAEQRWWELQIDWCLSRAIQNFLWTPFPYHLPFTVCYMSVVHLLLSMWSVALLPCCRVARMQMLNGVQRRLPKNVISGKYCGQIDQRWMCCCVTRGIDGQTDGHTIDVLLLITDNLTAIIITKTAPKP